MLEKQLIQTRGFKNTYDESGNINGFQIRVRLIYYRGIWLSQLRPGDVNVDGDIFPAKNNKWEFAGKKYTFDEISKTGDILWNLVEPATIYVPKKSGLAIGYHDVKVDYLFSSSYMPPVIDTLISETTTGDHKAHLLLCH